MTTLEQLRRQFHATLLESILTTNNDGVPSIADKSNRFSVSVAKRIVEKLGGTRKRAGKAAGQTAGNSFEATCRTFVDDGFHRLLHLRPGEWSVLHIGGRKRSAIAAYEQYAHLDDVARILNHHHELAASLGHDTTTQSRPTSSFSAVPIRTKKSTKTNYWLTIESPREHLSARRTRTLRLCMQAYRANGHYDRIAPRMQDQKH